LVEFFKSLALMLLPQQMMAEEITLSTTDLQKSCSILLQTPKDLIFLKKYSLLCPFLYMVSQFCISTNVPISSGPRARAGVHHGQFTSPSQGNTETQRTDNLVHTH
ncbi:hypothetical protein CHARACLAT_025655, partial [Characodon lateralis]|nr:hypothetical protein [Characodon lateralis]